MKLDEKAGFPSQSPAADDAEFDQFTILILPAMIYRTAEIPARADYLQFEYAVPTPADGDRLIVWFGGTRLFELPLFGTENDFIASPPIFVGDLAGTTATIAFSLARFGERDANVFLSNLKFHDVPLPGDLTGDDEVDRVDVAGMLAEFGRESMATFDNGDASGDGAVSLRDLVIMRSYMRPRSADVPGGSLHAPVPEPSAWLLALCGAAMVGVSRRWIQLRRE